MFFSSFVSVQDALSTNFQMRYLPNSWYCRWSRNRQLLQIFLLPHRRKDQRYIPGGCHPYLRNVSAFSVNFHLNRWRYSHVTSFLANHAAMFLGPWVCGSECCSSNSNAPDTSQKGLISIQSHYPREKMSKKAREKPAEAGSASVSPYGSVPSYELVTSQPNRLINLIWPECRTWFIGPWYILGSFLIFHGIQATKNGHELTFYSQIWNVFSLR